MTVQIRCLALFLLMAGLAFSQATTEGGNISGVDTEGQLPSIWHGVVGQTTPDPAVNVTINATPADVSYHIIDLGTSECEVGPGYVNLIFSNSSESIAYLKRGNLTILDDFIGRPEENGTATFVFSTSFPTWNYGTITGVPTTLTNAPDPSTFRMGYLNDQSDNLVFITRLNYDKPGFNGSLFDFQLMLPTQNGTPVLYYLTLDYKCEAPPPGKPKPPRGGGGSGIPVYNESRAPPSPEEEGPAVGPAENVTECDIYLYCEEWGECVDGYRYQKCYDPENCSDIVVYRVEECPPVPEEEEVPLLPEELVFIRVEPEFPCIPLALLMALAILLLYYYSKKRKKRPKRMMPG